MTTTATGRKPWTRWSDEEVDLLRAVHADGGSCGGAAERLGRPLSSVASKAKSLGLKWPTALPPEVIEASKAHRDAVRSEVIEGMYALAGKLLKRATNDADGFEDLVRGQGGEEVFVRLPRIHARAARDLANAVSTLAKSASAVEAALAQTNTDSEIDRYLEFVAGEAQTEGAKVGQSQTSTEE